MLFFFALDIDKTVIKIYYNKNLKLFRLDLISITLKYDWHIVQAKSYNLILKIAVTDLLDSYLPFIAFSDLYLRINIS